MKMFIRILLSPFIFLWACFMLFGGTIIPIIAVFWFVHFVFFISLPLIWLLRKGGVNVSYPETFFNTGNVIPDTFIGATIYIWFIPFVLYKFIAKGEIFTGE